MLLWCLEHDQDVSNITVAESLQPPSNSASSSTCATTWHVEAKTSLSTFKEQPYELHQPTAVPETQMFSTCWSGQQLVKPCSHFSGAKHSVAPQTVQARVLRSC